jgi:hypothetical protein
MGATRARPLEMNGKLETFIGVYVDHICFRLSQEEVNLTIMWKEL